MAPKKNYLAATRLQLRTLSTTAIRFDHSVMMMAKRSKLFCAVLKSRDGNYYFCFTMTSGFDFIFKILVFKLNFCVLVYFLPAGNANILYYVCA